MAFVLAGGFELVEDLVQYVFDPSGLFRGEAVAGVVALDLLLDSLGEDRRPGAPGGFAASSGAGEVFVLVAVASGGTFKHQLGPAGAVDRSFQVVVVFLCSVTDLVLRVQSGLDPVPGLLIDQRSVTALVGDALEGDDALVVGVGEHTV
ncbi:hypothetical protein [Nesterenkonia alkaliphila]|uniref:Uncharacterized protein n=1 Tax=Nesterenkonia alkaliphila TaxID=1463631 RepID=A0A7K1UKS0_9MICC|nr:hypothetical protein [Nesterenkonia alkaliphila]MVT27026.1 hypothetical protein [Nesterenkonia alkaliphila]